MRHYNYSESTIERAVIEADITSADILSKLHEAVGSQQVDVIIGGPPCQSFSPLGVAKDENNMENDPRNFLFESYVRILNEFLPQVFVFENVTGILKAVVNKKRIFSLVARELSINYRIVTDPDIQILQNVILLNMR